MANINPLKFIVNVENENGEFKKLTLSEGFCISLAYLVFLVFLEMFIMIPSSLSIKNIIVLSIYKVIIIIIFFSMLITIFIPKLYIPKLEIDKGTKSESNINCRNIIFLILFIIGFKLTFDATLTPLIKRTSSFNLIVNYLRDIAKVPVFFVAYEIVIGPIIEELLFRGIILNGFIKMYSNNMSIITSSLIFGLLHLNVYQFCMAFTFGIFLAFLYLKTHSIILCIFAHVFHNIYTSVTLLLLPKYFSAINNNMLTIFLVCILGLLFMIIAINRIRHN